MKILFLHGWKSTPGGLKPTYLRDHGHTVLNPALPDDDFQQAVRIAQSEFDQHQPDVVVGSSRGGAVAMNIHTGATPLVLLCPAWRTWGTATTANRNTTVLHSRTDETVPFSDSEELVRNSGLPSSALIEVGRDHRLADPEMLSKMLDTVKKVGVGDSDIGDSSLRQEAGVPRRFGLGILMVITTMCAVLFTVLRVSRVPPAGFLVIVVFFVAIGLGQFLLFKGQRPRRASVIVGACLYPLLFLGMCAYECLAAGAPLFFVKDACGIILFGSGVGAILGYLAGGLIAGVFLVIDNLGSLRGGSKGTDRTDKARRT
jgi:hypothetical protein